jgi:hypothetical protein
MLTRCVVFESVHRKWEKGDDVCSASGARLNIWATMDDGINSAIFKPYPEPSHNITINST